jgi:2-phospho-L-lactate/phosphoenolpyruvate guanylyltransferase
VNAVLLPVKRFADSKHRLAATVTAEQRELLARTMFEDVWETLTRWQGADELIVITAEPFVLERIASEQARPTRMRIVTIAEKEQISHSESTRRATTLAKERGITTLISIPIDTPAATGEELSELLELSRKYEVIVVPSGDGTGTNALVRTPPDAITAHFGPGSCRRHIEDAQTNFQKYRLITPPGLTADIDTPEEARQFLAMADRLGRDCRTARLLRQYLP